MVHCHTTPSPQYSPAHSHSPRPSLSHPTSPTIRTNPTQACALPSHALEVVALLDPGPALPAHGAAQRLALVGGGHSLLQVAGFGGGQVDRLLVQRDLGRQRLEVARRQEPLLLLPLPLERQAALLLGLGCLFLSRGQL